MTVIYSSKKCFKDLTAYKVYAYRECTGEIVSLYEGVPVKSLTYKARKNLFVPLIRNICGLDIIEKGMLHAFTNPADAINLANDKITGEACEAREKRAGMGFVPVVIEVALYGDGYFGYDNIVCAKKLTIKNVIYIKGKGKVLRRVYYHGKDYLNQRIENEFRL